jgi:hypothetical protein
MGIGTLNDPYNLVDALRSGALIRGETLYLRGGTYTGNFALSAGGLLGNNINIRAFENEIPIIDGNLSVTGNNVHIEGLVVTDSAFTDRSSGAGGHVAIDALGDNIEIINCVIRNGAQGLGSSPSKINLLVYGSLFGLCGWDAQLGHGLYPENAEAYKTIEHCIIGDNFGYGLNAWNSDSGASDYWKVLENIAFRNGFLRTAAASLPNYQVGGQSANQGHIIRGNVSYAGEMRVGDAGDNPVTDTLVEDNVLVYSVPFRLAKFQVAGNTIQNNRFYGTVDWGTAENVGYSNSTFPDNSYNAAGTMPDESFLFPNRYDSRRANLAIFNMQAQAASVSVDVSEIYDNGDVISVRNTQDYFNDVQELVVSSGQITIDMQATNRSVEAAIGGATPAKTFPSFGAFVLRKQ